MTIQTQIQTLIVIHDYDMHLNSRNEISVQFQVGDDIREKSFKFDDILESEFATGNIDDYYSEGEGTVIVDGPIEVDWSAQRQEWIETRRGRKVYTYNQFLRECMDDQMLINFIRTTI